MPYCNAHSTKPDHANTASSFARSRSGDPAARYVALTGAALLLHYLISQAQIPEYQVRWRWTAGSVAIWDNRCTQHYALDDYKELRRMRRVERPVDLENGKLPERHRRSCSGRHANANRAAIFFVIFLPLFGAVGLFYKDIDNFVVVSEFEDVTVNGVFANEALIPINGDTATVRGLELGRDGVGADLAGLMRGREEAGKVRIGELQVHLQADAQQARQVAPALRTVECRCRSLRPQNLPSGLLEVVAELRPQRAAVDVVLGLCGARHILVNTDQEALAKEIIAERFRHKVEEEASDRLAQLTAEVVARRLDPVKSA